MSLLVARLIVSLVLTCAPFIIFVILSGKADNALYLPFPLFGAVPAIIFALVLFAPIEAFLDIRGLAGWKNLVIPIGGGTLILIFVVALTYGRGQTGVIAELASGGHSSWGPLIVWSLLGIFWGLVWRSTEWLARTTGLFNG